jgi:hypothetical protein
MTPDAPKRSAWGEFVRGDPKPVQELFSHTDVVSLGNPFPFVTGWHGLPTRWSGPPPCTETATS